MLAGEPTAWESFEDFEGDTDRTEFVAGCMPKEATKKKAEIEDAEVEVC